MPPVKVDADDIIAGLRRMGLAGAGTPGLIPLTGGVSSDIYRVETSERIFVVKRALPKLRVAAEWHAPVARNAKEVAWMRVAGAIVPGAVPEIIGHDAASGLFAMAWLAPDDHPVWKAELHAGRADPAFAAELGRRLALIHARTAGRADLAATFDTDATFHSIRLEPYLEATARRHPLVAERLMALSAETLATHLALVHGDVSPKNILCGPHGPVFLDAECAWYGDPAFDVAFCLNHLLLKCHWSPAFTPAFLACFAALHEAYAGAGGVAPPGRIARLLPALLLARIDGKSPVEYITDEAIRIRVRDVALMLIADPPASLPGILAAWEASLSGAAA